MSSNPLTSAESFGQSFDRVLNPGPRDPGAGVGGDAGHSPQGPVLLGESVAVRRLRAQIQRIAPYFRIALIRGEMGSGKELVARAIHALSPGGDGPFVTAHAATLAESMAAGEAVLLDRRSAAGALLESAHGGTLYLRGAGELTFRLQTALLAFLRECGRSWGTTAGRRLTRIDSTCLRPGTIRILIGSNRDLRTLAAMGQFREDLYAHVSAVEIFVPPLRQRVEDIPLIAQWLLRRMAEATGQGAKALTEETGFRLQESLWPNNLRELERVVCQAAALAEGPLIGPRHLMAVVEPEYGSQAGAFAARPVRLHDVVQQHVFAVLTECGGNKLRAADLLGVSRSTLYRMLDAGSTAKKGPSFSHRK